MSLPGALGETLLASQRVRNILANPQVTLPWDHYEEER